MSRFSPKVNETLRKAGWYPGRQVPDLVASWKANPMLSEFHMFNSAESVLLEFGGLRIDEQGPGETCAREPFEINPTLAAYEGDWFAHLSRRINTSLYPLGEAAAGYYYWAIGENARVYLLMDELLVLGTDMDNALENLILGRQAKKIT